MHVVTKVLVVFAVILTILLSALTVSYSVNASRIVADYRAETNRRIAAENSAKADTLAGKEEQARLNDRIKALEEEGRDRQSKFAQLESENTTLRADKASAEEAARAIQNKVAQLGETVKMMTTLIESYRAEVTTLRDNEIRYRREAIQLADRINDLESQNEVLTQTARALEENVQELRLAMETQRTGAGATGDIVPHPGVVRGRVTSVRTDDATGRTLAQIDLGSNQQIRENMRLLLARGNEFLGYIIIMRTDLSEAIGRIDTVGKDVTVREGDQVYSTFDQ